MTGLERDEMHKHNTWRQGGKSLILAITFFVPCSGLLVFPATGPALASGDAPLTCARLVERRCVVCHFETRICQKVRKGKSKRSWKRTIRTMVRHGARLDSGEIDWLTRCLADGDSTILDYCRIKR